jgi:DNA-binding NarL/FixJ family response regulator
MNLPPAIRVALVDDHALVRDGIRALLSVMPRLEVVGEA